MTRIRIWLTVTAAAAIVGCAWPAAARPVPPAEPSSPPQARETQDPAPPPAPTPPAPPPAASTPPAPPSPSAPILRIRLQTDTPTERVWLAERLEQGLRRSPMSFNAVAHTPAKIRGETIFRDSDILPDPYREGGAVILIVRTGEMGLEVLLDLRDLYVNYYNSSSATKLKSPAPDQVTLYRVGLANHLRPLLRQACGAGAVSRCTIS